MFRSTFIHLTHLSIGGSLDKVIKHLLDLFNLKYSTNNFFQLFMVCSYVATWHIFKSIVKAFGAMTINLAKLCSGIQSIIVSKVSYRLVNKIISIRFLYPYRGL